MCVIEIYDFDHEVAANVECFDEACSSVTITDSAHTVESWRELSKKIEQALEAIHPQLQ